MDKPGMKMHHNKMDIMQRLMAAGMKGQEPLSVFNFHTPKVKEVLSTDLPDLQTKDNKADTFYLLDDGNYLHIEFQTTATDNDAYRFATYILGLYNNIRDRKEMTHGKIFSFVIYAPHIKKDDVDSKLEIGSLDYSFQPIFLKEIAGEEKYNAVIEKVRGNPEVVLSPEEKMMLIYRPLFNETNADIEKTHTML